MTLNNLIIQQGSVKAFNNKHLKISWNLSGLCNFNCSYCLNQNNKKQLVVPSKNKLKLAVFRIFELDFNSFEFNLLGGEPTLFPYLIFLIEELLKYKELSRITLLTNGSRDLNFPDDDRLKFSVSVHPLFVDKIRILPRNNMRFNILALPTMFDDIKKLYDKYNVSEVVPVRMPPDFVHIYEYTDAQKQWIIEHDKQKDLLYPAEWIFSDGSLISQPKYSELEFNQDKFLNFQNMYCLNNSMVIYPDGILQYTCYLSKKSKYSIYDESHPIEFNPKILKCSYKYCNCSGRLNTIKCRDFEEIKKYEQS